MTSPYDTYTSPLATRNASPAMLRLWSARHKFNTWRRIWLAVAEAMCEMGEGGAGSALVTREQVEELRAVVERKNPDGTVGITDDEIRLAEKYERDLRHDVMAHVHALGDACPKARPIIHLGMTSQDVVCNADLMILEQALDLVEKRIDRAILALGEQARNSARVPALGFTHYQPAQPVTVGRRVAGWVADLKLCRDQLIQMGATRLVRRGLRGATGTQASFLELFDGEPDLVDSLDARFIQRTLPAEYGGWSSDDELRQRAAKNAESLTGTVERRRRMANQSEKLTEGLEARAAWWRSASIEELRSDHVHFIVDFRSLPLTGQTYPRVIDTFILADLASVAAVLHKVATDIRLLSNRKELDEPFEDKQIGSSAMPYKRNPMRCERICGLTRFVMNLVGNAYDTAATQWLERTLDDSSNRRLSLPEAFLALDGALDLMHNVASGLIVHEAMVRKNLMAELPFMATENILMACVRAGGDRQEYHEKIRVHAQAAGWRVKHEGLDNDLLERLKNDMAFWSKARGGPLESELDWSEGEGGLLDPMRYVGRSVEQTERFIREVVEPLRERYKDAFEGLGESGPRV